MHESQTMNLSSWGRAGVLCCLLALGLLQQGCLAAAWVVAVGADSMRTSDITFRPFEESWVSSETPVWITEGSSLTSLAVLPVEGDADMSSRLTQILQRQTALQVVAPVTLDRENAQLSDDETGRAVLAKELSRKLAVDAVLFGRVAGTASHPSDWGWKDEKSQRLFLYLVDRDGHLLWKDELPYMVVTGSKPPLEDSVQTALTYHLMGHVHDLGLDDLGYLPKKIS
jgi:hypothetical protein